jgi:hypothetical protein
MQHRGTRSRIAVRHAGNLPQEGAPDQAYSARRIQNKVVGLCGCVAGRSDLFSVPLMPAMARAQIPGCAGC